MEREEAVAAAAKAGAAEAAAAVAAAAGGPASRGSASGEEERRSGCGGIGVPRPAGQRGNGADMGPAPAAALAEVILSEMSDDVMVLLSAGGRGGATTADPSSSSDDGGGDEDTEGSTSSSGSDDDDEGDGFWSQGSSSDPSPLQYRGGGSDDDEEEEEEEGQEPMSPSSITATADAAPDSASPVRLAPWEHRLGADEMARDSPERLWGAEPEEEEEEEEEEGCDSDSGEESGGGGSTTDDEQEEEEEEELLEERRELSSRMLSCMVGLLDGEAFAGDLLGVLAGFLETLPGDTDHELGILVSAARLVHLTLALTPPAARAVALADPDDVSDDDEESGDSGGEEAAPVDRRLGLEEEEPIAGGPKGKGRKRGRSELGGASSERGEGEEEEEEAEREGLGLTVGGGDEGQAREGWEGVGGVGGGGGRGSTPPPLPTLFIAGVPMPSEVGGDGPVASGSKVVFSDGGGSGESEVGEEAEDLGRRIQDRLLAFFHHGVACGCPALVEVCLQATLTAIWDRQGSELLAWGDLVDSNSFNHVMSSDLFRPAWQVGAEVLSVLLRNADVFREIAVDNELEQQREGEEDDASPARLPRSTTETAFGDVADRGCAAAEKSAKTDATAIPTPRSGATVLDGGNFAGGAGEAGAGDRDGGLEDEGFGEFRDSLLRRLCLDAVAVGEYAPFGKDVGLRLSVIKLVFSACQAYGEEAARSLFGADGFRGGDEAEGGGGGRSSLGRGGGEEEEVRELIPALVDFVRLELEDWERRRYSEADPKGSDPHEDKNRVELLKQAFQLLWALAMHTPRPLRDMAQGAGMFNTMVSVVSRFYNSAEMEEFQVHKEAMMLMEKMN
ncbi:unnamed protein product [Ectocarpus sp. 12 AP-2014]